ncbi:MAG: MBL fold metallo-hydrolase [Anaerolineae bacterium]|nr:MBL fold metallo-hydrolase [Anaerolineae bacterium]
MHIYPLDLHFRGKPNVTVAYLVVGPEGPVLVETGPGSTLKTLHEQLARHSFAPQDVKHLLVTHIHLDHAGASGWWARQGTQVYVHHIGAPHLIAPAKLLASAHRIYGDQMESLWGEFLAAPQEQITPVHDGDEINVAGLTFVAIETPGHANHHHIYRLGDVAFTGDAAGICLPGNLLRDLPAPPPEFNWEIWQATIAKIKAYNFSRIYPTHAGPVDEVTTHLDEFKKLLDAAALFIRDLLQQGITRDEMVTRYVQWNGERAAAAGVAEADFARYAAANPYYMSVDGISRYWRKKEGG